MARYYDRYKDFRADGQMSTLPFIKLPVRSSDKRIVTDNRTRFDKLSQQYYGNPYHGWLILQMNPEFGGLEFDIPENTIIIIPFPLDSSLERYQDKVEQYKRLFLNK
jgi:hypothetical protein